MEMLTAPVTREQVIEIRTLYRDGMTRKEVAECFNLDKGFVFGIINERYYKDDSLLPKPRVPRHEIAFHPESTLQGYHKPTKTVRSYAKHHRYGRIVAAKDDSVSIKINGRRTSRKRDVFIQECLTQQVQRDPSVSRPGTIVVRTKTSPTNAEFIRKLQDDKMSIIESQVILKSRGINVTTSEIEAVRGLPNPAPCDTVMNDAQIIDECMEILVPLWEKHKRHDKRAPDHEFWPYIHPARDIYRRFRDQINPAELHDLSLLGYEALEYFIETNATDQRLRVFWKPLFAKWYHSKYPGRNRNNGVG